MLKALIETLVPSVEAAVIVAFLLILAQKRTSSLEVPARMGLGASVVMSLFTGLAVANFGNREIVEGTLSLLATITLLLILLWLLAEGFRGKRFSLNPLLVRVAVPVMLFLVILVPGMNIVLFPTRIFIQTTSYLNTELILKIFGGITGVLLAFVLGLSLVRAGVRLNKAVFFLTAAGIFSIAFLRQLITVLQIAFVNGILPLTPLALKVMVPLINHRPKLFYGYLVISGIYILAVMGKKHFAVPSQGLNPAQVRKEKARLRNQMRWAGSAVFMLVSVVTLLVGNYAYANRKIELSPAVPVTPQEGAIRISLEEVSDGQLHRFAYTASDGTEMRFIVIQKGEGKVFGVALDACNICGVVGYYQRKDSVVCLNCDVVINTPTIGFPGGCNPIPLEHRIEKGNLIITVEDLEKKKDIFKE
ncbi:Fe-S-containing protein [Calderihabitans maritimus]|uniref:Membrane iron-sulfur containing protein FtrD-like domain-containing protein n=1 Tax=Calderihabitans maritimus TaxID=1246530 RepID=A0A1Z5HR57_9FIRM|nr:Fe-S-containing protein [Calderihabitans maritimus]GAW91994.1 hypothetical protein KKC1_11540 [Calderihabitans maritimus]